MELLVIRGLPGSGKSTLAAAIAAAAPRAPLTGVRTLTHLERDMFFMTDGHYVFRIEDHPAARAWCLASVEQSLSQGISVVVSNTCTHQGEFDELLDIARRHDVPITIIEMDTQFASIHNVPATVVARMADGWECADASWGAAVVCSSSAHLAQHPEILPAMSSVPVPPGPSALPRRIG